jgi:hypothetical protein
MLVSNAAFKWVISCRYVEGGGPEVAGYIKRKEQASMWDTMAPPEERGALPASASYQFQTTHSQVFTSANAATRGAAAPRAPAHIRQQSNWLMGGDVPEWEAMVGLYEQLLNAVDP